MTISRQRSTRPRIVAEGVAVDIELNGALRTVIVTREALDASLGPPPAEIRDQKKIEMMWLGAVQYNLDVVQAAAERKILPTTCLDKTVFLDSADLTGRTPGGNRP